MSEQLDSSQSSMKHLSGWRMGLSVQFLMGLLSWMVFFHTIAQVKHSYWSQMLLYFSHSPGRSIVKASLSGWRKGFSSASCGTADSRSVGVVIRASLNLVWIVSGAGPLGVNLVEGQHQGLSRRLVGAGRKPSPFCAELSWKWVKKVI